MYSVHLGRRAVTDVDRLSDTDGRRIYEGLRTLAQSPRPPGCRKLKGHHGTYRLHVGDYRVLYEVDDAACTVLVLRVQDRKDVYRDL